MKKPHDILADAAKTFEERNKVYGDNFIKVGKVMDAMFPDGITIKGVDDFNRWHLFELAVVKLTRYANNFSNGGHQDSIHDMIVYGAMVEYADALAKANKPVLMYKKETNFSSKPSKKINVIGYGNPPKHTRFKKGKSGNPKGRPKMTNLERTLTKVIKKVTK